MQIHDNSDKLIGEINTFTTEDGSRVISNTTYNNGRVIVQTISSRDEQGNVQQRTVYGGRVLP